MKKKIDKVSGGENRYNFTISFEAERAPANYFCVIEYKLFNTLISFQDLTTTGVQLYIQKPQLSFQSIYRIMPNQRLPYLDHNHSDLEQKILIYFPKEADTAGFELQVSEVTEKVFETINDEKYSGFADFSIVIGIIAGVGICLVPAYMLYSHSQLKNDEI